MSNSQSNYEQMKRQMQGHFLEFSQPAMIRRFRLKQDDAYLYLRFLGRMYRIDRRTGVVRWPEDGANEADYSEAMSIYDVLCCSKEGCRLSGEFVSVNNLPGVVRGQSVGSGMFDAEAQFFSGKVRALREACVQLGGIPVGNADAGFQINVFDFLPVRLLFWDADEEFPPSLNLLWDRNLQDFIHYETSYFIAGHMLKRIREIMQT